MSPSSKLPRTTRVKIQGKTVTLYSLGFMAHAAKRSARMLRVYEKDKILPAPIIQSPSGIRWYLADELKAYGKVFTSYAPTQGKRSDLDFTLRHNLKEYLLRAKHNIVRLMNSDILKINAELADAPKVANVASLCRINRIYKRIEKQ
jgi:hypothetical protein